MHISALLEYCDVADPAGLFEWLAKERGLVTLGAGKDIQARRAALESIVRGRTDGRRPGHRRPI